MENLDTLTSLLEDLFDTLEDTAIDREEVFSLLETSKSEYSEALSNIDDLEVDLNRNETNIKLLKIMVYILAEKFNKNSDESMGNFLCECGIVPEIVKSYIGKDVSDVEERLNCLRLFVQS